MGPTINFDGFGAGSQSGASEASDDSEASAASASSVAGIVTGSLTLLLCGGLAFYFIARRRDAGPTARKAHPTIANPTYQGIAELKNLQDLNGAAVNVNYKTPDGPIYAEPGADNQPDSGDIRRNTQWGDGDMLSAPTPARPDSVTNPMYEPPASGGLAAQAVYAVSCDDTPQPDGSSVPDTAAILFSPFLKGTLERKMQLGTDGGLRLVSVRRTNPLAANVHEEHSTAPARDQEAAGSGSLPSTFESSECIDSADAEVDDAGDTYESPDSAQPELYDAGDTGDQVYAAADYRDAEADDAGDTYESPDSAQPELYDAGDTGDQV